MSAFGRFDILVNNAGIYQFAPIDDFTEEHFHRQFNTNVLGLLLASREAVKHFGEDGGSIINIGSSVTSTYPPSGVTYTASKSVRDRSAHLGGPSVITRLVDV